MGAALAAAALAIGLRVTGGPRAIHRLARLLLAILGIRVRTAGPVPASGLVAANHLSYLDILVFAAQTPTVFVAKEEVRSWPVFGWFAQRGGTLFVERGRPTSAARSVAKIAAALRAGERVVLFPEGTSSGGAGVLPFKSSLLAAAGGGPVWTAALAYSLAPGDGDVAEEVCYWKDMSLPGHLWRLLGKRGLGAALVCGPVPDIETDRKALARLLHRRVGELRKQAVRLAPPPAEAGRPRRRRARSPMAWRGLAPRA